MYEDEDRIWTNPDHLIEMYKSELDDEKSNSFWNGILIGMAAMTVSFAVVTFILIL